MSEMIMKVVLTGNKEEIVPLSADEIAQRNKDIAESEAEKIAAKAVSEQAAVDKAALLAKLGITAEEAKLLLS